MHSQKVEMTSVKKIGEMRIGGRSLPIFCARKVIYFGATAMKPEEAQEAIHLLMQAVAEAKALT